MIPQNRNVINKSSTWRCRQCSFDNNALLSACEICQTAHQIPYDGSHPRQVQAAGILCPFENCKFLNAFDNEICVVCSRSLFADPKSHYIQHKPAAVMSIKMIKCPHCTFQNHSDNDICVGCDKKMKVRQIPKKPAIKRRPVYNANCYCAECGQPQNNPFGAQQGFICQNCTQNAPSKSTKSLCIFCEQKIAINGEDQHDRRCASRNKFYSRENLPTFERCSELQIQTIIYMHKICQKRHYQAQKHLLGRIKKLGFNSKDLQNLHHYLMHYAPIIIHMRTNTNFQFFEKDTHYRNCFEVMALKGMHMPSTGGRVQWQDRMFAHKHHHATPFERVKYGTMNFTNDPKGVNACQGYGQSYFLLKPHVRDRCTIADMDTASPTATIGTFRFIFHVLNKVKDAQLISAFQGSKGKEMLSHVISSYKQIQIHGPVQFSKDIERVYICKNELAAGNKEELLKMVENFCEKNKVEYELFEHSQIAHLGMFGAGYGQASKQAPDRVIVETGKRGKNEKENKQFRNDEKKDMIEEEYEEWPQQEDEDYMEYY